MKEKRKDWDGLGSLFGVWGWFLFFLMGTWWLVGGRGVLWVRVCDGKKKSKKQGKDKAKRERPTRRKKEIRKKEKRKK